MRITTRILPLALLVASASMGLAQRGPLPETAIPAIDEAPTKAHSYDWMERHNAVVERVKQGNVELILVGDSITHMWGGVPQAGGPGQPLWDKYFGSRNAVNLGFGWDRTQHVLWRLQNGEIDGIHPKVAVLMIGTNNIGTNSTDDIATGITAIVNLIHKKLPRTKLLLLGIFPRDHNLDTPNRRQVAEVNQKISGLAKRKWITYLDLGSKFLESDGTISSNMMPDFLHPSLRGYTVWAQTMEPTLAKLFGDKPREP